MAQTLHKEYAKIHLQSTVETFLGFPAKPGPSLPLGYCYNSLPGCPQSPLQADPNATLRLCCLNPFLVA